jgi:hypothetical protein
MARVFISHSSRNNEAGERVKIWLHPQTATWNIVKASKPRKARK